MHCPNCGHENADDARFCSRCGTSLSITCPVCSTVSQAGAAFCRNCGTALETPGAEQAPNDLTRYLPGELLNKMLSARAGRAMQGERRTVTMLFADLVGSTAAAGRLDPEDWADIVNGAFEHMIAPVYRYEGTLARLQGDAILAFFGAPIAHEDDPLRAMRAGLEIVEAIGGYRGDVETRWGIPIEARVGINTGLVVVGEVGSDLRVEYTALGDAINVAARMEQTAEPGTVRVTHETRMLVGDAFEFDELGPIEVKGKLDPVQAHRVVRFVGGEREDASRPFVGRDSEVRLLDGLRDRLMTGAGWIASITAEAGIGKTRLVQEMKRRTAGAVELAHRFDAPGAMGWMAGVSHSYDTGTPFATVREVLARWWGLADSADPWATLERAIEAAGLSGHPDAAALIGHIAGIEPPPDAVAFIAALQTPVLHARATEALAEYLTALAHRRPLFIVIEDLHWADDLTLALVEAVMNLTEQAAIGLVVAMRPYRDDPSWRIHQVAEQSHHHRYHAVALEPLDRDAGDALLERLLPDVSLPQATRARILERADGNPLFLEQIVRSLHESGDDESSADGLPTTLNGLLTARLDRLDDGSRLVVQMASVLGTEFHRDTLSALVAPGSPDREITDLLRRGLLVETGPMMLAFRHALMQEAAYGTILRKTRRTLHRSVADYLIDAHDDRVADISRHLVEAGDVEDAFPYLVAAGLQASRSMALADAIRQLTTAIEHTPIDADPELIVKAHEALGEAYALVPDLTEASAAYQKLFEYGEQAERPSARVAALNHLAYATAALGADLGRAGEYLEQARVLAEEAGDDVGLTEYHMNACFVASLAGEIGTAVTHDEETVRLAERTGVDSMRVTGLLRRSVNYANLLDFEQAVPSLEQALAAAREAGAEEAVAIMDAFGTAIVRLARADLHGAVEIMQQAETTLERYASFYLSMDQRNVGWVLLELGDPEGALSRFAEARRVAGRHGQAFVSGTAAASMAHVYSLAGVIEPVAQLREEAFAMFDLPMAGYIASTAWADLGYGSLAMGDLDAARSEFERGLNTASVTQFLERPRLLLGQTLAAIGHGDLDRAETSLLEAESFTRTKGWAMNDAALGHVRGELLLARGAADEADEALVGAHRLAMDTGQRLNSARILETRARIAVDRDDPDAVARHSSAARDVIETMAVDIADETLRTGFLDAWTRRLSGLVG